jgi:CRP-like cAMP-binding protein
MASFNAEYSPLIRKLESAFALSEAERQALVGIPIQITSIRADQDIVREGDRPSRSFAILEGFACAYKVTSDGKRQILAFYIPGDTPDMQTLHLSRLDFSLATLTPSILGFIQHETLRDLCDRFPRLASAFWRDTLIDAAIYREWVVNVGRREAYSRMAHVFCEMLTRMKVVGLARDHSCEFPITQAELADATGLSGVHANRVVQELRVAGLIELKGGQLKALDWEKLKEVGQFDPAYLHLNDPEAAAA